MTTDSQHTFLSFDSTNIAPTKPIVFKSEDSLWQMLESGEKTFDMRHWDLSDDRIYRLAWGHWTKTTEHGFPFWEPVETFITFVNKVTGAWLKFRYRGMEFTSWAPGWVFLQLGDCVGKGDWGD